MLLKKEESLKDEKNSYDFCEEISLESPVSIFKKKFCLNLAKILQSIYNFTKEKSQDNSLKAFGLLQKQLQPDFIQNIGIKLLKALKVNFYTSKHLLLK